MDTSNANILFHNQKYILHRPTKINYFQKARNFRSFLGYIGVTESENALSFVELALVFNKIFSLGPIFHEFRSTGPKFLRQIGPKLKILVLQ